MWYFISVVCGAMNSSGNYSDCGGVGESGVLLLVVLVMTPCTGV